MPVDLLRQFFGAERVPPQIGRLAVTWFWLVGGWEADFRDRARNLTNVRLASWLWPPSRWKAGTRVSAASILLELQEMKIAKIIGREGHDLLVEPWRNTDGKAWIEQAVPLVQRDDKPREDW